MAESAVSGNDADTEVSAEELYRFGRGRGSEPLTDLRHREVAAFLEEHPEEARWTEKLSEPIPSPLDVTPQHSFPPVHLPGPRSATPSIQPVEDLIGSDAMPPRGPAHRSAGAHTNGQGRRAPRRLAPWMAWIPAAAAALAITMALDTSGTTNAMDGGLPESPVLRSASSTPLLFPRGRVLAPVDGLETYSSRPLFEVADGRGGGAVPVRAAAQRRGRLRRGRHRLGARSPPRGTATADRLRGRRLRMVRLGRGQRAWSSRPRGRSRSWSWPRRTPALTSSARPVPRPSAGSRSTREDVRRLHSAGYLADARHRAQGPGPGRGPRELPTSPRTS